MRENENGPFSYMTLKNNAKCIKGLNMRSKTITVSRRKYRGKASC